MYDRRGERDACAPCAVTGKGASEVGLIIPPGDVTRARQLSWMISGRVIREQVAVL